MKRKTLCFHELNNSNINYNRKTADFQIKQNMVHSTVIHVSTYKKNDRGEILGYKVRVKHRVICTNSLSA